MRARLCSDEYSGGAPEHGIIGSQCAVKGERVEMGDEERKREKLRAKIAKSGLWDETQPEEKEEPTWDRKGDQDYRKGRK